MARRRRPKPADYVGYKHPPTETQFKPGQSGNPRGRPKGSRSVGAMLQEVVGRKVNVTENGRIHKIPALEVALRRLTADAMRGDPSALKLLLSLYDRYGQTPETKLAFEELLAEDRAILSEYMPGPFGARRPGPSE